MRRPTPIRTCPNCGTRISWRARTCFMCGVRLDEGRPRRQLVVWSEVAAVVVILLGLALWWTRGPRPDLLFAEETTVAEPEAVVLPTPTPEPPTPTPSPTPSPTPFVTPTPVVYVVRSGDSLEFIAGMYGVSVEDLVEANQLEDPDRLRVGQELLIPAPRSTPIPKPSSILETGGVVNYQVKEGDTLSAIAVRFRTSISAIQKANDMGTSELIRPGEVLVIPIPTPTAGPTPLPTSTPTPEGGYHWPAPALLSPPDGATVSAASGPVLRWSSVGLLAPDEWYVVRVWPDDQSLPHPPAYWTKSTSWRVGNEWRPPEGAQNRRYYWQVAVVQAEWDGSRHRPLRITSPLSATRTFAWGQE